MRPFPVRRRARSPLLLAVLALATPAAGCAQAVADAGSASHPPAFVAPLPAQYGDDAILDRLWEACDGGSDAACEELFWASPVGSGYEQFSAGG